MAATHGAPAKGYTAGYAWRTPNDWWLKNKRYFAYVVRELTAVFVALWLVCFLAQIPAMGAGAQNLAAHAAWVEQVHSPGWVIFSIVALFMAGFHSWTWFNLMGTVMWMRFGKSPVPAKLIISSMFLAWIGASLVVAFFIATPIVGG